VHVIITGGSGLIGRALTESLAADGHDVTVLSRNPAGVVDLPSGVNATQWDGKTAEGWGALVEKADAVVNLAGESIAGKGLVPSRWTVDRKNRIRQSRLDAGNAVMDALESAAHLPSVLVQASAIGYYSVHGDEMLDENSPPGSDFLAQLCVDWEASTEQAEALGVRRVIIRTGLLLSTAGGVLPLLAMPFRFYAGGVVGSGKQYYSWIHVADEIAAIRFLIEADDTFGAYNLTAPQPVTAKEFARVIGKVLRKPARMPVPAFAMRAALGDVSNLALEGQRVLPKRLLDAGFEFRYAELEETLRDLLG
jgi:uncharacterized protein (TIGR01777 family)